MVERLAELAASVRSPAVADAPKGALVDFAPPGLGVRRSPRGRSMRGGGTEDHETEGRWAVQERRQVSTRSLAAVARDRLARTEPPRGSLWAVRLGYDTELFAAVCEKLARAVMQDPRRCTGCGDLTLCG